MFDQNLILNYDLNYCFSKIPIEYNVNQTLIDEGHAYEYEGGKKKMFVNKETKKNVL